MEEHKKNEKVSVRYLNIIHENERKVCIYFKKPLNFAVTYEKSKNIINNIRDF